MSSLFNPIICQACNILSVLKIRFSRRDPIPDHRTTIKKHSFHMSNVRTTPFPTIPVYPIYHSALCTTSSIHFPYSSTDLLSLLDTMTPPIPLRHICCWLISIVFVDNTALTKKFLITKTKKTQFAARDFEVGDFRMILRKSSILRRVRILTACTLPRQPSLFFFSEPPPFAATPYLPSQTLIIILPLLRVASFTFLHLSIDVLPFRTNIPPRLSYDQLLPNCSRCTHRCTHVNTLYFAFFPT